MIWSFPLLKIWSTSSNQTVSIFFFCLFSFVHFPLFVFLLSVIIVFLVFMGCLSLHKEIMFTLFSLIVLAHCSLGCLSLHKEILFILFSLSSSWRWENAISSRKHQDRTFTSIWWLLTSPQWPWRWTRWPANEKRVSTATQLWKTIRRSAVITQRADA